LGTTLCPHCRQNAPIVYRGVNAFCTACGAPRMPLAGTSVNLAGQPSKVGGTVARVFGWITLIFGTLVALGTFAMCSAIAAPGAAAPYILAVPLALVAWLTAWFLLKGGKELKKSGAEAEKNTRSQAVFALANMRGGMITPADLAQAIGVTPADADAILTNLAKESPDHVNIEVDDNGTIYYRFAAAHWQAIASNPAYWERPRPRVDATPPTRVDAAAGESVRVEPREAEPLEDELAQPEAARRHAR